MNFRKECMRIDGAHVGRERVIEVHNPYTGACIGSAPTADPHDVRRAFEVAHAYRPRLSRYERSRIQLGGNDPLIVMDDADLEEAASTCAKCPAIDWN